MTKPLEEMSKEELGKLFPIIITQYDQLWPELYLHEKSVIEKAVSMSNIVRISHFGSTSVPGMSAKPTIDILLELCDNADTKELIHQFKTIGYKYSPQRDNPSPHMMFMKGYGTNGFEVQAYHVHVRYSGDWDELYFRDFLIINSEIAKEYGNLKIKLKEEFEFDREAYTLGKTEFIKRVTEKARTELRGKYTPAN